MENFILTLLMIAAVMLLLCAHTLMPSRLKRRTRSTDEMIEIPPCVNCSQPRENSHKQLDAIQRSPKRKRKFRGSNVVFAVLCIPVIMSLVPATANADSFADRFEFYIGGAHSSDLFRTPPEPTHNFIGAGFTLSWSKFELDVAHGLQNSNCYMFTGSYNCKWESGTQASVRWYPFRSAK